MSSPTVLDHDTLFALLAQERTRGGYIRTIGSFDKSGELYMDFMQDPEYSGKVPASVFNSVKLNLKKAQLEGKYGSLKCVRKDDSILLINTSKLPAKA